MRNENSQTYLNQLALLLGTAFDDFMADEPGTLARSLTEDQIQTLTCIGMYINKIEELAGVIKDSVEKKKFKLGDKKVIPLPIKDYQPQSQKMDLVRINKELEEHMLRAMDTLAEKSDVDKRWLAIARTDIEKGFMALNRSIFNPQRVTLG